jgi:hydrogenase expression/formation protein HypD
VKYLDEYREPEAAHRYVEALRQMTTRPWTIMEVCGGQTHAIVRYGIQELLPDGLELLHGPGCPVCVTPVERISRAVELARRPDVILASFGDMLRVPAGDTDLLRVRAEGGDVRIVYTPLDALELAVENPNKEVVFFAVGFETTAPAIAMTVIEAARREIPNFSALVSHVRVPQALDALLQDPDNRVQGFLAAGHVTTIMGTSEYEPIVARYGIPIVATGFEPLDILQGITMVVAQLEEGRAEVENQYARAVRTAGNEPAMAAVREVFDVVDREWRGIGTIAESGFGLSNRYAHFDADERFEWHEEPAQPCADCIAGQVLRGLRKPDECPQFGKACTPDHPLGAPMVSSEGACAAYHRYGVA